MNKSGGLTTRQRRTYIEAILSQLQTKAHCEKKKFDYGDTLLALAYKSDQQLLKIAKLCGVK
jgi:hypothetical protein